MTITIDALLTICASFTCVCVAAGWLIKIIRAAKKPVDTVNQKLNNDDQRLKTLEEDYEYLKEAVGLLMRCDMVVLAHLRTNNATGRMIAMENEINAFLTDI